MANSWHHAESSARKFGGRPDEYAPIHNWFDESKSYIAGPAHRALRHHAQGIFEAERVFGITIKNSEGKDIPVRLIGEQHVKEDFRGMIPSLQDWFKHLKIQAWMMSNSQGTREQLGKTAAEMFPNNAEAVAKENSVTVSF
jgi:hypothetical protein